MDRLESMAVLVAVVSAGSLSAASRQLRMPLPTVSRKLSQLESQVKAQLLVRSTRKLVLTEAGRSYVAACKRILEDVAEAERGASGEYDAPRGELVISAPVVFGRRHVLPVTTDFLKSFPHVDVRLLLTDRSLSLIDDHLDLAVRVGTLPDSRLVAVRVGQVRSVVCASPAYMREHGTPRSPEELTNHHCITFAALADAETWTFAAGLSVRVHSRLVVNTAEAAIDAAVAGIGLTRVLSYQVADAVQAGTLAIALRKFEAPPLPLNLIYTRERMLPAKLRTFIDFSTPRLRARLAGTVR